MSSKLRRVLLIIVCILVVLSVVLGAAGYILPRRSFPKTEGEIHLAGLDAPVEVYRDSLGVPHIYAFTPHDLFFAQGYVHAQERFWQMDFWRHIGMGRLSEMFGEKQVDADSFLRTLGWARVAQRELEGMDPEMLSVLTDYAEGVNAYLADHKGSALSLEYAVLGLLTPDYQPEPWQPLHTVTWAKAMAWNLGGNLDLEIERAILLKTLSAEQVADLFPLYPSDSPVIVSGMSHSDRRRPAENPQLAISEAALSALRARIASLDALLGPRSSAIGSNNWVISGKLTDTGMPLLANDPHLAGQMPSIWYENGLHCAPKGPGCPFEVVGFSFPGTPGVIIGHSDRIAWGLTNLGPDVQDVYIEKINPQNPNQYQVNDQWVDMQWVNETIRVAGGEAVELTVRYTRHGPLITEVYGLQDFADQAGLELPEHYAIALRWTALDPGCLMCAFLRFNRAQNWEEFREATRYFDIAAQNVVYADVDGNIGYLSTGRIPIRANGQGILPVPGWTDAHEWVGYIPFEELPFAFNPPQGYLVTANNAVVGADYSYLITLDWNRGYRARRIVEMIEAAPGPIGIPYIQQMQGDDMNLNARELVPLLMSIPLDDPRFEPARSLFQLWDYQNRVDSAPAALYAAFWKHLLADTFHDDLPEDYWPDGHSRWFSVVSNLVKQPDSAWWDNRLTPEVENRDQIFRQAFGEAVAELEERLGKDPAKWKWGDLHTVTFENETLGQSGVAPIEAIFNRGPFRTAGGADIVNATAWDAATSFEVNWLPSMRMIVDPAQWSNSLAIHTTGQSGHAYHPHYIDMADLWRTFQYRPMLWQRDQIEKAAEAHLRLLP